MLRLRNPENGMFCGKSAGKESRMIFVSRDINCFVVRTANSSASTLLIVLLVILTFPFWIGIAGGLLGLVVGVFGGIVGALGSIIGALGSGLGHFFGGLFSWTHIGFPFVSIPKGLLIAVLILVVVLISKSRKTT
jgi:hypothetical protein